MKHTYATFTRDELAKAWASAKRYHNPQRIAEIKQEILRRVRIMNETRARIAA